MADDREPDLGDAVFDDTALDDAEPDALDVEIPAALDGERVDRVLSLLAGVSRSEAAALVDAGAAALDGAPVPAGKLRVAAGQRLVVAGPLPDADVLPVADATVAFEVVHADDDVVVVDKPAGLVVHPGPGHDRGTLVNGLLARFPEVAEVGDPARPGIVHRLDRGTSGLLVVARSPFAYEHLVHALSVHRVERGYEALVWGWPEAPQGLVDAPIGRSPRDPLRMAVVAGGKPARTWYEVVATHREPAEVAELACRLETGRTHQIRVHLAALGHPVVGDPTYGRSGPIALDRPYLHAARLAFTHPRTGMPLRFGSPLPADLVEVKASLD